MRKNCRQEAIFTLKMEKITSYDRGFGIKDGDLSAIYEAIQKRRDAGLPVENILEDIQRHFFPNTPTSTRGPVLRTEASYARLVRDTLSGVRGGVSRSEFLSNFFVNLQENKTGPGFLVCLQGYPDAETETTEELKINWIVGSDLHRIDEMYAEAKALESSTFVHALLGRGITYDFVLKSYLSEVNNLGDVQYRDEFRTLHGNQEAWICALQLAAKDPGEPQRSIVGFYPIPNRGRRSRMPEGAEQEWNVVELLPDIFAMLNARVKKDLELMASDQKKLIADVAPSALAHELGTTSNLIISALEHCIDPIRALQNQISEDHGDLSDLTKQLVFIRKMSLKSQRMFSAFSNIERRHAISKGDIQTVLDDIFLILSFLLNKAKIELVCNVEPGLTVSTNIGFVEHVLLNVIINAMEAFEQEGEATYKRQIHLSAQQIGEHVEFIIANNGPRIPASTAGRIFEKGVTTKPMGVGHGHGLYLCKQVASQLSGSFGFGTEVQEDGFKSNVSFRLYIPKLAAFEADS